MPTRYVPHDHPVLSPYLAVKGAARLRDFLRHVFDAQVQECHADGEGRIMHAEARIGDSVLMFGDACEQYGVMNAGLHLYVPDVDATYRRALEHGATSIREPADQFYGDRASGVRDPFGNTWWISTHKEDLSAEEIERRAQAMHASQGQAPANPEKSTSRDARGI